MRDFSAHPRLRIATLAVASYGAASRGLAYLEDPNTSLTTYVDNFVPLWAWSAVWLAAAGLILVGIFHRVFARWALSLTSGLWLVWAISYFAATLTGDQHRGWVTGSGFLVISAYTWIMAAMMDNTGPPPPRLPDEEDQADPDLSKGS